MKQEEKYRNKEYLLESFKKNDLSAFRELYDIFYHPLLNYASRILHDPEDAEDILSEVFVIIWQKRTDFNSFKSLAAYLYTVTRNACFTQIKKNRKITIARQEFAHILPQTDQMDTAAVVRADLIHYSLIAAQQLPGEMKKVFQLIYIEGFSASEAAKKLNLSINTVNAQKANAVKRVRATLLRKGLLIVFV